jgi:hypothetical protein
LSAFLTFVNFFSKCRRKKQSFHWLEWADGRNINFCQLDHWLMGELITFVGWQEDQRKLSYLPSARSSQWKNQHLTPVMCSRPRAPHTSTRCTTSAHPPIAHAPSVTPTPTSAPAHLRHPIRCSSSATWPYECRPSSSSTSVDGSGSSSASTRPGRLLHCLS